MSYPDAVWERAMTVQQVILKALAARLHWYRAADILGFSPRTLRRWRERYEKHGHIGRPLEAAGAVDAKNASTAPWKTPQARFSQLPQAFT